MTEIEALILEIGKGNRDAFQRFYAHFQAAVFNICLSYLKNREEAEEAVQDIFMEVFYSASNFRNDASASTWVYRIAINKCLDRLRHRKRKKRFAFLTDLFNPETGQLQFDPSDFEHPGVLLENKELASILFKAMDKLPENQQTAFILKQVEGLPQKEIAAIMNMGEKAVESLLQRAKQNLRKLLGNYYDNAEGK